MKRILIFTLILLIGGFAFSQNFDAVQNSFDDFAAGIAPTIPTLANVGLQWSDAWIGYIPHFGAGVTVGTAFVPVEVFTDVYDAMGQNSSDLDNMPAVGIPLPAISGEGRIGGIILPFDIGVKFGMVPGALADLAGDALDSFEYQMIGFDVRYRVVKEGLMVPEISVGAGYTNLQTKLIMPLGADQTLQSYTAPDSTVYDVNLTNTAAEFGWTSNIIDVKAQISKNVLFILRPYIGAGVSFGFSNVYGGVNGDVVVDDVTNGGTVPVSTFQDAVGGEFDIDSNGITFSGDYADPSFRVFAGTSFSLFLLKLDLSATINPVTSALGAALNARIQL